MAIEIETLKAMIRDYGGFEISDEELEIVRPALDNYLAEVEKLGVEKFNELDLTGVMSARLLRAQEGG